MRRTLMLVLATSLLAGCATHVVSSGGVVLQDDSRAANTGFSDRDRKIILDYYKRHKQSQPGTATGLVRQDVLPLSLQSRSLPAALETQLTPLSEPYVRLEVGNDVVLIDRNTRIVIDIIYGVGA